MAREGEKRKEREERGMDKVRGNRKGDGEREEVGMERERGKGDGERERKEGWRAVFFNLIYKGIR